jgi:hypothetical protein
LEASSAPEHDPRYSQYERETWMMVCLEQQMQTCANALGDESEFGRELGRAARGLRRRLRSREVDPSAPRRLRAIQSVAPLVGLLPL